MISKTVRTDYANPTQIAHKVLADRIGKRDPGNKPAVGSRVPFVYIQTKGKIYLAREENIETRRREGRLDNFKIVLYDSTRHLHH